MYKSPTASPHRDQARRLHIATVISSFNSGQDRNRYALFSQQHAIAILNANVQPRTLVPATDCILWNAAIVDRHRKVKLTNSTSRIDPSKKVGEQYMCYEIALVAAGASLSSVCHLLS